MKKYKICIISLILLVLILIGITVVHLKKNEVSNLTSKSENTETSNSITLEPENNAPIDMAEISNFIIFDSVDYEAIEDVVFYDKNLKMNDTLKNDLTKIANELKTNYPGKTILYLSNAGGDSVYGYQYKFTQLVDGQTLENADMIIRVKEDGNIDIRLLENSSWKDETGRTAVKITQEQAEQIVLDYLFENPKQYKELRKSLLSKCTCTARLHKYNSRTCWMMKFSAGYSYVIIDAETGKILDAYCSCPIMID